MTLRHPRQWGGCWLALELWNQLDLDSFWASRLPESRKGTGWLNVLKTLVTYRLLDPDSEWRLHRDWFANSAMADLLDEDDSIAAKDTLYTQPEKDHQLPLHQHNLTLPDQPPPRLEELKKKCSADP